MDLISRKTSKHIQTSGCPNVWGPTMLRTFMKSQYWPWRSPTWDLMGDMLGPEPSHLWESYGIDQIIQKGKKNIRGSQKLSLSWHRSNFGRLELQSEWFSLDWLSTAVDFGVPNLDIHQCQPTQRHKKINTPHTQNVWLIQKKSKGNEKIWKASKTCPGGSKSHPDSIL